MGIDAHGLQVYFVLFVMKFFSFSHCGGQEQQHPVSWASDAGDTAERGRARKRTCSLQIWLRAISFMSFAAQFILAGCDWNGGTEEERASGERQVQRRKQPSFQGRCGLAGSVLAFLII